ncbi:general transcription factor 3C polypeptide 6 isoform X1 [Capsicum chacoense]
MIFFSPSLLSLLLIHCTSLCCYFLLLCLMENKSLCDDNMEEEEAEYVLLDLDGISSEVHIPPNAPYVLSGLDTLNPILIIDGKIKLIGEYDETIGTCLVFNESVNKKLESFREEIQDRLSSNYSVILNKKNLPMSLVYEHQ